MRSLFGAFTEKVDIVDPAFAGYVPIAPAGELSPRSRTSVLWDRQWPVKPDVVFEGGNLAHDGASPGNSIDDLQLLTTYHRPDHRHFTTLGDTSAATALAAGMAGSILAARPKLWRRRRQEQRPAGAESLIRRNRFPQ